MTEIAMCAVILELYMWLFLFWGTGVFPFNDGKGLD